MLPGFPDAPLWVVVWLIIVGSLLFYFGAISRGRNRVIAMLLGATAVLYAGYPAAARRLGQDADPIACYRAMQARGTLGCPASP